MANVEIRRFDTLEIDRLIQAVATRAPTPGSRSSTFALYPFEGSAFGVVLGNGFSYDASGRLVGGTITSLSLRTDNKPSNFFPEIASVEFSDLYLPVPRAVALASAPGGAVPALLIGSNAVSATNATVTLFDGDDTVAIRGNGTVPPQPTRIAADGGGGRGLNTAVLTALRDQAVVGGGGETASVSYARNVASPAITADLLRFDELRFIDGSTYENARPQGAQAALVFLGILGRLPDPANAGNAAQLARRIGLAGVAAELLATAEGQAATSGLDTAGFVTRLYNNVLQRAPEPLGAAGWQRVLDAGTRNRAQVAALFAEAPEAREVNDAAFAAGAVFAASPNAVAAVRVYQTVLDRLPEADALIPIVQQLDAGTTTLAILENTAVTSPEFRALLRGAADDASFVDALQRNLFGTVDPATTDLWANLLDRERVTRAAVADAFAFSRGADSVVAPFVTGTGVAHV